MKNLDKYLNDSPDSAQEVPIQVMVPPALKEQVERLMGPLTWKKLITALLKAYIDSKSKKK